MLRPLVTWVLFGLCLLAVLAAMGWISLTVTRLDRDEQETRRQAEVEERVRLALWRMDSSLAHLLAQENARPYYAYSSFYPAEQVHTRAYAALEPGDILIPSPLLTFSSPRILLHFQYGPKGELTSPQVPRNNDRDLAEAKYTGQKSILAHAAKLEELARLAPRQQILQLLRREPDPIAKALQAEDPAKTNEIIASVEQQLARNTQELRARYTQSRDANVLVQRNAPPFAGRRLSAAEVLQPVWLGDHLILARLVRVNGGSYLQGCWLDWAAIQTELRAEIAEVLPHAVIKPNPGGAVDARGRMLATLPAVLHPGAVTLDAPPVFSPIKLMLLIAWSCMLLPAVGVAILLLGAVSLSQRRGAFVSAVTHELRTPLTTFRIYTEMLTEGMVPDEKRADYLATLRAEADRLGHMVENVLAYARLERGRPQDSLETVRLHDLVERAAGQLNEVTERAGARLELELTSNTEPANVHADVSAVERILVNLVDNACKYAAATEGAIHLETGQDGKFALLRVRDHGPGIPGEDRRRLFRPFFKSAREAAHSAPGVGLGLALSRRLARQMGGDLRIEDRTPDGACFVLSLPLTS